MDLFLQTQLDFSTLTPTEEYESFLMRGKPDGEIREGSFVKAEAGT